VYISITQKNGGGAANLIIFIIDIANVEFIETESQLIGFSDIGNRAEQDDGLFPVITGKGIILDKLLDRNEYYFDFAGYGHPDYGLAIKIAGNAVIDNDNAFGLYIRNPCFQYLAVDKPVVNPDQSYIVSIRHLSTNCFFT
jgi:hypothetical protein